MSSIEMLKFQNIRLFVLIINKKDTPLQSAFQPKQNNMKTIIYFAK